MATKDKKFLIDVVPLIRLPLDHEPAFTYMSEKPIPEGSQVLVEFFRREIGAIVLRSHRDFERFGSIRLKPVGKIISPSLLTREQLALASSISREYFTPLGVCLRSFVPKIVKAKKNLARPKNKLDEIVLPPRLKKELAKILRSKDRGLISVNGFPDAGKYGVYAAIGKNNQPGQTLILNPEILTAYHCQEKMSRYFPAGQIASLRGNMSAGEFYRHWEKIRLGKAKVIIGTRTALFAPYKNLRSIILNDNQDQSYKQWDMSPRYDTRVVAEKLSDIHQAKIFFQSPFPPLADRSESEKIERLEIEPSIKKNLPAVEIINMKLEWKNGKLRSPISSNLEKMISETLAKKEQAVIFLNQQGMSRFSVCANCQKVLRCPRCGRALVLKKSGEYFCSRCSYRTSLFPSCPDCRGSVFKNYGFGIDKIEKELGKFFPAAKIAVLNSANLRRAGRLEEIYRDFTDGNIDILIGTQLAIKGWDMPKLTLAAIIDADNPFNFPEYNTSELFWNEFIQCASRVALNQRGKVFLETYHPQEKIFSLAASMDSSSFFAEELENRRSMKYPPYYRLIKISFKHKSLKVLEKETAKIFTRLREISLDEIISPPYSSRQKSKLIIEQSLLIKIPGKKITKPVRNFLEKLPAGWTIDVDPVNIT